MEPTLVRATIHQAGAPGERSLAPGDIVPVDATDPAMRRRIRSTALVKLKKARPKPAPVSVEKHPASVPDPTAAEPA